MEHSFLFRKQTHELKTRQMVEEINFGRHVIKSARSKYRVLARSTVTKWLARAQAVENAPKKPSMTLVEQVVQHADALTGQVKQLQKQLEQAQWQVLYYKNVFRVAEQEHSVVLHVGADGGRAHQLQIALECGEPVGSVSVRRRFFSGREQGIRLPAQGFAGRV